MSQLLEDVILGTDLDGGGKNINNVAAMTPAPSNLTETTDPRLSDARAPLDGSVTNASVAPGAAIAQDKLNLNDPMPASWIGTNPGQAAPGDLAQYLLPKGQPNGYASLDNTGKVPAAQMPVGAGLGTVTSVGLVVPGMFTMTGDPSPITGAGVFQFDLVSVAAESWFGNPFPFPAPPQTNTAPLPPGLIPNLDAIKITTGTLLAALLPVALGLGLGHTKGAVPDPGDGSGGALATDYLARDMTYKVIPAAVVSDVPYGSAWNGETTKAPSENAVYDWGHKFDFDDNGKVNVLDQGAGIPVTDASGVITSTKAAPSGALVGTSDDQTLSQKRITPRLGLPVASPTPVIGTDEFDVQQIGGLAVNITSMTANLFGTPAPYDKLTIAIRDDGFTRSIAWGGSFASSGAALPVATVPNKWTTVFLMFREGKWRSIQVDQEP